MSSQSRSVAILEALIAARGCPQFASFTYTAKATGARLTEEQARHVVVLGASLESLYERDVAVLGEMIPKLNGIDLDAAVAILESRETALLRGIGADQHHYIQLDCPGLKVHVATGDVHVMGLKVSKVLIQEGTYREVNSKPLTVAKNRISADLPSSKLRQFNLGNDCVVQIDGQTLVFGK